MLQAINPTTTPAWSQLASHAEVMKKTTIAALFAADGKVIGEARTQSCGDPLIDATLPADGDYFVKVHDALYRNGAGYHYRLNIGSLPHLDFVFPPAGLPGSNEQYTVYGCNLPGGSKRG